MAATVKIWRPARQPGVELLRADDIHHVFPKHFHDAYCIPVIERGAMISLYRGRRNELATGTIDILDPGEVHTSWGAGGNGYSYRCFYVDAAVVQRAANAPGETRLPPLHPRFERRDRTLFAALRRAHTCLEAADDLKGETLLTAALAAVVARCLAAPQAGTRTGSEPARIARVAQYLAARVDEPVTLCALAALVGLNPVYLVRAFRRHLGLPPHAWQRQLRLARARALLRQRRPIAEVAAASGFADQSHLTRVFRDAMGVTPAQYARGLGARGSGARGS